MKPLYSPAEVQFRVMKEEPTIQCDGTIIFPWATFFPDGHVHTWDRDGVGGENWNANEFPGEDKFHQALLVTPYTNPAPLTPGEKCYLREAWRCVSSGQIKHGHGAIRRGVAYRSDSAVIWQEHTTEIYGARDGTPMQFEDGPWRSPVTMPQWAARRFFTIVSCEPMRVSEVTEEDCLAVGLSKITKDNGRTWKFGMADRDGLPGTDNTGWAWEDWKVDHREAFKRWWNKDKEWAWRIEVKEV